MPEGAGYRQRPGARRPAPGRSERADHRWGDPSAFAGCLVDVADALRPWQQLSPFHQALQNGPSGAGPPGSSTWMAASILFVAPALPVFDRRDIATA
ncbi:hypothetical protein PS9374_05528 [Planomonospora sphaerica]|uniref:Uncharacterized protein n=1 Tax=Planomonospora sphaerica TaxID=161355 RepID=A0A171DLR9_9ACTN|nr:hypothetical protein PS9374_05528 [Planomonospora sphaerica]